MSFAEEFGDMMTDTMTWYAVTSRDGYGKPSYGSSTEFDCRLVRKHKMVIDPQGEEILSSAQAWVKGTPEISPQDKVVLSDTTEPVILAIERYQDETGPSHTVVFFR